MPITGPGDSDAVPDLLINRILVRYLPADLRCGVVVTFTDGTDEFWLTHPYTDWAERLIAEEAQRHLPNTIVHLSFRSRKATLPVSLLEVHPWSRVGKGRALDQTIPKDARWWATLATIPGVYVTFADGLREYWWTHHDLARESELVCAEIARQLPRTVVKLLYQPAVTSERTDDPFWLDLQRERADEEADWQHWLGKLDPAERTQILEREQADRELPRRKLEELLEQDARKRAQIAPQLPPNSPCLT
jgi:hypothetical protein